MCGCAGAATPHSPQTCCWTLFVVSWHLELPSSAGCQAQAGHACRWSQRSGSGPTRTLPSSGRALTRRPALRWWHAMRCASQCPRRWVPSSACCSTAQRMPCCWQALWSMMAVAAVRAGRAIPAALHQAVAKAVCSAGSACRLLCCPGTQLRSLRCRCLEEEVSDVLRSLDKTLVRLCNR